MGPAKHPLRLDDLRNTLKSLDINLQRAGAAIARCVEQSRSGTVLADVRPALEVEMKASALVLVLVSLLNILGPSLTFAQMTVVNGASFDPS
jgi:hypothetical protein